MICVGQALALAFITFGCIVIRCTQWPPLVMAAEFEPHLWTCNFFLPVQRTFNFPIEEILKVMPTIITSLQYYRLVERGFTIYSF
jgi:hypothetical protein